MGEVLIAFSRSGAGAGCLTALHLFPPEPDADTLWNEQGQTSEEEGEGEGKTAETRAGEEEAAAGEEEAAAAAEIGTMLANVLKPVQKRVLL